MTKPKPLKDTPLVEINDRNQLPELVEELRKFRAIAVDLEHHSYRSFMGFTCLMQISTTEKDYLIDTLALRNDLWILNEIFTKPDITKVSQLLPSENKFMCLLKFLDFSRGRVRYTLATKRFIPLHSQYV